MMKLAKSRSQGIGDDGQSSWTGCSKRRQLEQLFCEIVRGLAIDASIEEVKDMKKIMTHPILMTPGLVINEELVCCGKVPTKAEVT